MSYQDCTRSCSIIEENKRYINRLEAEREDQKRVERGLLVILFGLLLVTIITATVAATLMLGRC